MKRFKICPDYRRYGSSFLILDQYLDRYVTIPYNSEIFLVYMSRRRAIKKRNLLNSESTTISINQGHS